ncbi:hypothetical protein HAX54_029420 [Datura stramonium]|uniref:Uncharacterized protein n=1 Tax=Datura stramonium TaxID=4076 RepID=A0ABS8SA84_DATST|nr:hypothetical protein [Datura stramonium]
MAMILLDPIRAPPSVSSLEKPYIVRIYIGIDDSGFANDVVANDTYRESTACKYDLQVALNGIVTIDLQWLPWASGTLSISMHSIYMQSGPKIWAQTSPHHGFSID